MLVQSGHFKGTTACAVRFGNVLGSRGSVIPIFQRQIARGGPVNVTHPEIRRYFMTISEASQLVIQAGALGEGSDLFLLDMGDPVRIVDLARDMIRLAGLEPEEDVAIRSRLRPGEKLTDLWLPDEVLEPTLRRSAVSRWDRLRGCWTVRSACSAPGVEMNESADRRAAWGRPQYQPGVARASRAHSICSGEGPPAVNRCWTGSRALRAPHRGLKAATPAGSRIAARR
jgi:hypothetical protein